MQATTMQATTMQATTMQATMMQAATVQAATVQGDDDACGECAPRLSKSIQRGTTATVVQDGPCRSEHPTVDGVAVAAGACRWSAPRW